MNYRNNEFNRQVSEWVKESSSIVKQLVIKGNTYQLHNRFREAHRAVSSLAGFKVFRLTLEGKTYFLGVPETIRQENIAKALNINEKSVRKIFYREYIGSQLNIF